MTKAKFKIGDNVRLTNFGFTYTTYEEMFELMGFKDTQSNSKVKGKEVGTIFGVQLHEDQDTILYAIRTADDREVLVGEKGLIKVAPPKEEPKQETLEEAAKNYAIKKRQRKHLSNREFDLCQGDFINGAKWQQEHEQFFNDDRVKTLEKGIALLIKRQEKMYSEAEVYDILVKHTLELFGAEPCTLDEFFDKVKKR